MSVERRRYYLEDTAHIIERGLTFYMDAKGFDNTSKTWTEEKNGYVFQMGSTAAGAEIYKDDKAIVFPGYKYMFCNDAIIDSYMYDQCTIEVCFKGDINTGYFLYARNVNDSPAVMRYQNTLHFSFWSHPIATNFNSTDFTCASLSSALAVVNGNQQTQTSASAWGAGLNGTQTIGIRNNNYTFKGEIYSIAIYNRLLTYEERLANYAVYSGVFNP